MKAKTLNRTDPIVVFSLQYLSQEVFYDVNSDCDFCYTGDSRFVYSGD